MRWEKMSKSKGNGVEPSRIVREVGVDATRLNVLFKVRCCCCLWYFVVVSLVCRVASVSLVCCWLVVGVS